MTSFSAKGYKTCENDFWDREFVRIRLMPVVLFVLESVHQIESCMSKKDKDNCLTPFTNELSTMEWSSQ
jgi:hypothetical protein